MNAHTGRSSSDCRSEEGITIGLIDSLMAISRVLRPRREAVVNSKYEGYSYGPIGEALKDLQDVDIRECVNFLEKYKAWKPFWRVVISGLPPPIEPYKRGIVCASYSCDNPDCRVHGSNWAEARKVRDAGRGSD